MPEVDMALRAAFAPLFGALDHDPIKLNRIMV
jgi:hypothetical protein